MLTPLIKKKKHLFLIFIILLYLFTSEYKERQQRPGNNCDIYVDQLDQDIVFTLKGEIRERNLLNEYWEPVHR